MIETFILNSILVALAVIIHFEMLSKLSIMIPELSIRPRLRVLLGIFGSLVAHVLEIWLFAFGYYFMIHYGDFGSLEGRFNQSLVDCTYFSFITYTSLGFSDIIVKGGIRFLAGMEALTGLVLITWTASFMFIEMQKLWKDK